MRASPSCGGARVLLALCVGVASRGVQNTMEIIGIFDTK